MSKFEFSEVVAMRAMLLDDGAAPLVPCDENENSSTIAMRELRNGKLIFVIERDTEDGCVCVKSDELYIPPHLMQ